MINIFIDTSDNALIAGLQSNANVDPLSLPFFYGDTIQINVYLFTRLLQPAPSTFQFSPFLSTGNSLSLYISNGEATPTIYASQNLAPDPTGAFFTGTLGLNGVSCPNLLAYFTANPTASRLSPNPNLVVGLQTATEQVTVFNQPILLQVGNPGTNLVPQPPLTPISLQQANALYVPVNPSNGGIIYLKSPTGHTLVLRAKDNSDGSCSFDADQIN